MPIPLKYALGRRYASPAQLNTVLFADAARWPDEPASRSVYSRAFRRAARLAYLYMLHRAKARIQRALTLTENR